MNTIKELINSENWEETIKNSGFSLLEVERYIDESYKRGYAAKDEKIRIKLRNIFSSNLVHTHQIMGNLIAYLNKLSIYPTSAYLKIDPIANFSVILTVKLEDYVSEGLLKAYSWISDTASDIRTENYNLDLSFIDDSKELDFECLDSDGYRLKYKN